MLVSVQGNRLGNCRTGGGGTWTRAWGNNIQVRYPFHPSPGKRHWRTPKASRAQRGTNKTGRGEYGQSQWRKGFSIPIPIPAPFPCSNLFSPSPWRVLFPLWDWLLV